MQEMEREIYEYWNTMGVEQYWREKREREKERMEEGRERIE